MIALLVFASVLLPAASATAAELTIRLCGMENRTGNLQVAVFAEERAAEFTDGESEAFAAGLTLRLADAQPGAVLPVRIPLAPGRYAVRVIHDENMNGVLDRGGLVGTPQESYGYSLNVRARVAAVEFNEAAITVSNQPVSVDVRVAAWRITGGDDSPCPP
ncbi:MAG: DUF2141 domain-containing protein [Candidatus Binatia bacterium]